MNKKVEQISNRYNVVKNTTNKLSKYIDFL